MRRLLDEHAVERLWARDGSLFSDDVAQAAEAAQWMGWLGLSASAANAAPALARAGEAARAAGITDVVLLGMGGSSLAPLVLGKVLGSAPGAPALHVLDTTSPWMVVRLMERLLPGTTLVIVSSKSGSTIEPLSLYAIFRAWMDEALGADASRHFVAVTDPGSGLEALAGREGFAAVFHGLPDVGGRYSALTVFGTVPAALCGIDVAGLAASAAAMEDACRVRNDSNPALRLAAWVADGVSAGRDKLTFVASERYEPFGLWVEQLVAESTGKDGKGVVPVVQRCPLEKEACGEDRLVFVMRTPQDGALAAMEQMIPSGTPLLEVVIDEDRDLGAEFVRWEIAVALTGHLLGVDPFNQPNVAEAKKATTDIMAKDLAVPEPQLHLAGISITTDVPTRAGPSIASLASALDALLDSVEPGAYLAVLAYLPDDREVMVPLAEALEHVAQARRIACCLELGPRYLHSTGQLHKAGPRSGRFLMITARDEAEVEVPGKDYTLAELIHAQAAGDYVTLAGKGLPIVRVDLPEPAHGPVRLVAETLRGTAGG